MSEYPMRFWGIVGKSDSGKTTFLATNAEPDQAWIDPDHRVEFVKGLIPGRIVKPTDRRAHILPEHIQDWLEDVVLEDTKINSVIFDGMTKVFERASRQAAMRMSLSPDERKERGLNANKRTDSLEKSNAMSVIRNAPGLGVSCYFVWHVRDVDANTTKTSISGMELKILNESIAVTLEFSAEGKNYSVKVKESRDFNTRPANTGFTLTDKPNNFWRGGALRLERAMYTTFNTEGEAINWAMEKLGKGDYGEVEAHFQDVTRKYRDWPIKCAMWVDDIYGRVTAPVKKERPPESNGTADTATQGPWSDLKVGAPIKVMGKNGIVDGTYRGVNGELIKVEVDGREFNVSAERVTIPAEEPTEIGVQVDEDWDELMAEVDAAREEASAEDVIE